MSTCKIEYIGKHRSGKPKYWCKTHFTSDMNDDNEIPLRCRNYNLKPIGKNDRIELVLEDWNGGVGMWGSLDPVFNTSKYSGHQPGVHLHARSSESSNKHIDNTFKEIKIKIPSDDLFNQCKYITINEAMAHAYTASMVFGMKMKYLECVHCKKPHIDADYYSVTYHTKHYCTYCGREFRDYEPGISNPVVHIQHLFKSYNESRTLKISDREIKISQKDFLGGIQIWGSNPAIIWTRDKEEEHGIHVHVFTDINSKIPYEDETFGKVIIDDIELNSQQIRYLMVQQSLTHLQNKIASLFCSECNEPHLDINENGVHPHKDHLCLSCGCEFTSDLKCVSNPAFQQMKKLMHNYRSVQK